MYFLSTYFDEFLLVLMFALMFVLVLVLVLSLLDHNQCGALVDPFNGSSITPVVRH